MSTAVMFYAEVHLILTRSMVEAKGCDDLYATAKWMDEITMDGMKPFTTVEIVGKIASCGCGFGLLTRCLVELNVVA